MQQRLVNTNLQDANEDILNVAMKMTEYQEEQLTLIKEETDQAMGTSRISSIVVLVISIANRYFLNYLCSSKRLQHH